jgi:tetratricopeptide (TPR) repeat protein
MPAAGDTERIAAGGAFYYVLKGAGSKARGERPVRWRFTDLKTTRSLKALFITAAIYLALSGCATGPKPVPVEEPAAVEEPVFSVEEALAQADSLLDGGRVGEAATLYGDVLRVDPASFEANLGIGMALLTMEEAKFQNQRDYAPIRDHFEAARQARPDDPRPHEYLGTISYDEKDYDAAIGHLTTAARLEPGDAGVHELLGLSLAEAGRAGDAKAELHRALSIDPSLAEANLELGKIYEKAGNNTEARAYLEKALSENPNLHLAAYYLQRVYYGAKLYDLAEAKCREFLKVYPEDIQSLEILGNIYRIEGRADDVFDIYTRLTRIDPDNTSYWSPVIQYLVEGNDYEAAIPALEEALKQNPYYAYGNVHYGKILLRMGDESVGAGDYEEARRFYTRAAEHLEKARVDDRYQATAAKLIDAVNGRMRTLP